MTKRIFFSDHTFRSCSSYWGSSWWWSIFTRFLACNFPVCTSFFQEVIELLQGNCYREVLLARSLWKCLVIKRFILFPDDLYYITTLLSQNLFEFQFQIGKSLIWKAIIAECYWIISNKNKREGRNQTTYLFERR